MAGTALTQARYDALPPLEAPTVKINDAAMKNDAEYQTLLKFIEGRAALEAQRKAYLANQHA